nr:NAC domain-containing protein [Tanacetum cinerariifolium]
MSSYNHFSCSWCGCPFNGENYPGYSSVGSGNVFVYDSNPYSYNETPNFFNQPPHTNMRHTREMMNLINSNQDLLVDLYHLKRSDKGDNKIDSFTKKPLETLLMRDEVISTTPERENDKFINSIVDDLFPIPKEEEKLDINLPLGEHLDTLSTRDREIDFNPSRDIEELDRLLADDPVPVPRVFDGPLGNSNSGPRSYDVTFSNPLFDFNDDYTLCYDNSLFDEEFEDISSLDPLESTLVIDESTLLVTPLPASNEISLREVERFDPFFSLT